MDFCLPERCFSCGEPWPCSLAFPGRLRYNNKNVRLISPGLELIALADYQKSERTPDRLPEAPHSPEDNLSSEDAFKLDLYFWLQALSTALVFLIAVFTLVGRIISVDGNSMYPTLHHRDMLLLQSAGYQPRSGDVVVLTKAFDMVTDPIVKRVIAVGGQQVDIDYDANTVAVDGRVLNEPYLGEEMLPPGYEHIDHISVPENCIFVMGDNRNHSSDSRYVSLGVIDQRYVLGRALCILFPLEHFGPIA